MIIKVSGLIIIRRQVGKGMRGAEARTSLSPPRSGLWKAAVGSKQGRRGGDRGLGCPYRGQVGLVQDTRSRDTRGHRLGPPWAVGSLHPGVGPQPCRVQPAH